MAIECPNGHGRQNIIVHITPDNSNPRKASDVVARKLQCGCVVGGKEYEKFRAAAAAIDLDRTNAIQKIEEEARKKKGAAYSAFVMNRGGVSNAQ